MILFIVFAGWLWMTSAATPANREKANHVLTNAIVGFLIVLSSWLVIDFFMKTLYGNKNFGPWSSILKGGDTCIILTKAHQINLPGVIVSSITGTGITPVVGTSGGTGSSKMDVNAAASYADSHAESSSGGACATYVRKALAAGGLTSFNTNHPEFAYQYGPFLMNAGFVQISSGGYTAQKGDVVVFQQVPGHDAGHIAIYDGSQWVSDFKQPNFYVANAYKSGTYTLYRP